MASRWILLVCGVLLAGCVRLHIGQQSSNNLLDGIGKLKLVDAPGITYQPRSGGGGGGQELADVTYLGELEASGDAELPADFAKNVLDKIRDYLVASGATITGGGSSGGGTYSGDSAPKHVSLQRASVRYVFKGARGIVTVYVIERDYPFGDKRIVGQLVVSGVESR